MKKVLYSVIFLLCFSSAKLYAQYGLQLSLMAPSGDCAYLLKPAPALEVFAKIGDDDDMYSVGAAFGYSSFKPTQDTFRTYAVGGQYNQLFPGYEVIHSYEELSIGVTNDLRILPDAKITPVIGFDLYFYVISIADDSYAENVVSSSTTGDNYWLLSVLPRAGLRYQLNKEFYLEGFFGRSMSITGTAPSQAMWKTSISFIYYPF